LAVVLIQIMFHLDSIATGGRMLARFLLIFACLFSTPAFAEWHEASSENFLIVADQNERDVREFTERLERFHNALSYILKREQEAPSPSNRLTIFVVRNSSQVQKLAGDKSGFLRGFYQARAGGPLAFISRVESGGTELDQSEQVLFHEYAHHVMHGASQWATTRWLSEGFAEFFSSAKFEKNGTVGLGLPAYHRGAELNYAKEVPIEALLDAEEYKKRKTSRYDEFYGRSWLLYHYLQLGGKRPGQLTQYQVELANGASDIEAAKKAFGDLKQLDKELSSYLKQSRMNYLPLSADKLRAVGPISVRKMRPAEAAVMPVVLESKRGVNEETAKPVLVKAQAVASQYPDDPAVQAALAEAEHDAGNYEAAVVAADKALTADPKLVNAHVQKIYALSQLAEKADDAEAAWKKTRRAITALNRIETNHPIPLIYYYRSLKNSGQEVSELAAQGLERALEIAPYDQGVRWEVVQQLMAESKWALAYRVLMPLANNPHYRGDSNPAATLLEEIKAKLTPAANGPAPTAETKASSASETNKL
jgi:tetratricopeptide (TPR) repeat protein